MSVFRPVFKQFWYLFNWVKNEDETFIIHTVRYLDTGLNWEFPLDRVEAIGLLFFSSIFSTYQSVNLLI